MSKPSPHRVVLPSEAMKLISIVSIFTLATMLGCGKDKAENKTEPTAAPTTGAKSAPGDMPATSGDNTATKVGLDTNGKSLGGDPVKLKELKFGGSGYDGEFNEALDSWKFEKWEPQPDETNDNVVVIYIDGWQDGWPADVEGFATKLGEKDFLDFGSSWPVITSKTPFEGGWVITGDWSDGEDTEKAFAVQLTKLRVLCRGTVKPTAKDAEKSRTEAVEACKSSTL
jgi:hypothetical protein